MTIWTIILAAVFVVNEYARRREVKARTHDLDRFTAELEHRGLTLVSVSRDLFRVPVAARYEGESGEWAEVEFRNPRSTKIRGSW